MAAEQITIEVDAEAAPAYRSASAEDRRKIQALVSLRIREAMSDQPAPKYARKDHPCSHHIFTREGVEEISNLPPRGSLAKPYQARQVRQVVLKHKLAGANE